MYHLAGSCLPDTKTETSRFAMRLGCCTCGTDQQLPKKCICFQNTAVVPNWRKTRKVKKMLSIRKENILNAISPIVHTILFTVGTTKMQTLCRLGFLWLLGRCIGSAFASRRCLTWEQTQTLIFASAKLNCHCQLGHLKICLRSPSLCSAHCRYFVLFIWSHTLASWRPLIPLFFLFLFTWAYRGSSERGGSPERRILGGKTGFTSCMGIPPLTSTFSYIWPSAVLAGPVLNSWFSYTGPGAPPGVPFDLLWAIITVSWCTRSGSSFPFLQWQCIKFN